MYTKTVCVLLTYNRLDYAKMTLEAFYDNVVPKPDLHIADDGSPPGYVEKLVNVARRYGVGISSSSSERGGYGRNYNLATQVLHGYADKLFMLEDDWRLFKPLNLDELASDIDVVDDIDSIRLGYMSYTQPLWGCIRTARDSRKYLLLDANSPEPHIFAGHPRLETVDYQREVGPWPEGLSPGETEFAVAHVRRARYGVAWPLGLDTREGYGMFAHIGTVRSW